MTAISDICRRVGRYRPARRPNHSELRTAGRLVVAGALSWQTCVWLGISDVPGTALFPAVMLMGDDPYATAALSGPRAVGVVVGVLLGVAALSGAGQTIWGVLAVLIVSSVLSWAVRSKGVPNRQICISALMVLIMGNTQYPALRVLENAVGLTVCLLLSPFVLPPDPRRALERDLGRCREEAVDTLTGAAAELADGRLPETSQTAEGLREQLVRLAADQADAVRGLRWNITRRGDRAALDALGRRIRAGRLIVAQVHYVMVTLTASVQRDPDPGPSRVARQELAPVLAGVGECLAAVLDGRPPQDACRRAAELLDRCRPLEAGPRQLVILHDSLASAIRVAHEHRNETEG